MKRFAAFVCALVCALALPAAAEAAVAPTGGVQTGGAQTGSVHTGGAVPAGAQTAAVVPAGAQAAQASGTVVAISRGSLGIEAGGGRMSVVNALTAAANAVTAGDFPYVYGGGHADAGIASIGIKGPGYNGRRIGFDCSGSVAAVLAGAGVWQIASGVPADNGIITQLMQEHLIARGVGRGPTEVTLYDDPGVHIFMNINGRFFGTSDGGGGGNPNGGAGWLDDGAPDASSRTYKAFHLLPSVLGEQTSYTRTLTFKSGAGAHVFDGVELGDDVQVGYTQAPNGILTVQHITATGAA